MRSFPLPLPILLILLILPILVTGACGAPPSDVAATMPTPPSVRAAESTIRAVDLRQRIAIIADDSMVGRATPSRGLDLTARYVAREFESFGLDPAVDGGYIQTYEPGGEAGAAAPNVIGILRGADPALRDTYVVFSAHMDHLGIGRRDASGDSIYNGADDDASGTAAVIEIAEAFAGLDSRPARSIVFLTVSGEERGLWGSAAFVAAGPIPVRSMVADVNIDMIGRNAPDTIVAIGIRYSDMGRRILDIAREPPALGLAVVDDQWPAERFFFRSDHYNFASAGVPALFLFAGTHPDYHMPSDEVERIDADKVARVARLAFRLGLDIATDAAAPGWTREGLTEVRPGNRN